jgi:hypothetical protein
MPNSASELSLVSVLVSENYLYICFKDQQQTERISEIILENVPVVSLGIIILRERSQKISIVIDLPQSIEHTQIFTLLLNKLSRFFLKSRHYYE